MNATTRMIEAAHKKPRGLTFDEVQVVLNAALEVAPSVQQELVMVPATELQQAVARLKDCAGWNTCPCGTELEAVLAAIGQ